MRSNTKHARSPATAITVDATNAVDEATRAWIESNGRFFTGLLELNAQMWAGWFALQQTGWRQAQTMVEALPLWMSWQYGTEQLA